MAYGLREPVFFVVGVGVCAVVRKVAAAVVGEGRAVNVVVLVKCV